MDKSALALASISYGDHTFPDAPIRWEEASTAPSSVLRKIASLAGRNGAEICLGALIGGRPFERLVRRENPPPFSSDILN
jgi:hypothetical protein